MKAEFKIGDRCVGQGHPVYIVAEMSANHNQDYEQAVRIVRAAREAGADAIKVQTYTPGTITLDCDNECFRIGGGTIWDGRTLYDLYGEASMPWEWQPKLKLLANDMGMDLFSSPFDSTAVDFLETIDVPVYKIASFELVDIPLLRYVAKTGKPMIVSTGMATLAEIDEAMKVIRAAGCDQIALLKCSSAYPAPIEGMNLRTISHMADAFGVPVGLSDHTKGIAVPVAAVSLGACMIEKHFTLSRSDGGPDCAFSLEPDEFKSMVEAVRSAEKALGSVHYGITEKEAASRAFRRSIFVVRDIEAGEKFTVNNIRSIRPGHGIHTRFLDEVLQKAAAMRIKAGTPLSWDLVAGNSRLK